VKIFIQEWNFLLDMRHGSEYYLCVSNDQKSATNPVDAMSVVAHNTSGVVAAGFIELFFVERAGTTSGALSSASRPWRLAMQNRGVADLGADGDERPSECHLGQPACGYPTNWFELGATLCSEGFITADRLERALEAVRLGVARA